MKTLLSATAVAAGLTFALSTALPTPSTAAGATSAAGESATILSAFFGLNDSRRIKWRTIPVCRSIPGGDGMPVIFSLEVDDETLDAEDFQVTTASGETGRVDCVTLQPADEPGELRTALVIGQYGSAEDQAVTVQIVGDVMSLDGSVNFKGAKADVIPLEAGPTMILAETVPQEEWLLGGEDNCPSDGVMGMVRAVWTGGVTKPGGDEIDDQERQLYRVTVKSPDGTTATVTPIAIGDLNDNDNNHELCLDVEGEPVSVFFPAGALTDPNEDLNPDTDVAVTPLQDGR